MSVVAGLVRYLHRDREVLELARRDLAAGPGDLRDLLGELVALVRRDRLRELRLLDLHLPAGDGLERDLGEPVRELDVHLGRVRVLLLVRHAHVLDDEALRGRLARAAASRARPPDAVSASDAPSRAASGNPCSSQLILLLLWLRHRIGTSTVVSYWSNSDTRSTICTFHSPRARSPLAGDVVARACLAGIGLERPDVLVRKAHEHVNLLAARELGSVLGVDQVEVHGVAAGARGVDRHLQLERPERLRGRERTAARSRVGGRVADEHRRDARSRRRAARPRRAASSAGRCRRRPEQPPPRRAPSVAERLAGGCRRRARSAPASSSIFARTARP